MRPSAHPEEGTGYVYTSSMENKGPKILRSLHRGLCSLQYFPGNTSFCQWSTGTSRGELVLAILAALLVHDRNQHTDGNPYAVAATYPSCSIYFVYNEGRQDRSD